MSSTCPRRRRQRLKDGNVDAAFLGAGYPTSSVQDIASQNKVRLLPIDADKADALIAKYPLYTKTTIPAGTYAGFDEDVPTISVMAMLVATDKVDDKMGYDIAVGHLHEPRPPAGRSFRRQAHHEGHGSQGHVAADECRCREAFKE